MRAVLLLFTIPVGAEFHIGLYNLTVPEASEEVATTGFTHVLSDDPVVAEAARRHGLKIVGIPRPAESERSTAASAVAVWYIADEPEINRQTPEDIARIATAVRRWDPAPANLVVAMPVTPARPRLMPDGGLVPVLTSRWQLGTRSHGRIPSGR